MNKLRLKQILPYILVGVVLITVITLILLTGHKKDKSSYAVGLIITGEKDDSGWNSAHYNGAVTACDKLGTKLIVKENIPEWSGKCAEAIHELVDEGAGMIILSSYSYSSEVKETIDSYPDIAFYSSSSEYQAENVTSYFGRMYQARYLTGIIAGMKTESDSIGYVAAMPNSEVNRGINAFTLGVKSINPNATVYVSWTDSWENAESEQKATEALIKNKSVDVITYHQNQHYTAQTAEKMGVYSIGYNRDVKGLSEKHLTAAVWNWDSLYYQIIREYVQGKPNTAERRWFDIDSGVIGLSDFSSFVDNDIINAVSKAKNRISSGNDIFSGEIYDNNGVLRCGENEALTDEMLFENMDWFVDGVEIYDKKNR